MISSTTGVTSTYGSLNADRKPNELNRDAFLMLLITQLSNQDPLKPMEDKEFIAQLAQFSSLEQIQQVNKTLEPLINMMEPLFQNQLSFGAASWIGRTVTVLDPNPPLDANGDLLKDADGNEVDTELTTKVEGVRFTDDGPRLRITVMQLARDPVTGELSEVEKKKDVPMENVLSVD